MAASFDFVRRTALALPDVVEGVCYGTPAFYLRKKLMLRLREDGETLVIKLPIESRAGVIDSDPDVFSVTDHYLNYPCVLADLNAIGPTVLEGMILGAWRLLASRKQLTAFEQSSRPLQGKLQKLRPRTHLQFDSPLCLTPGPTAFTYPTRRIPASAPTPFSCHVMAFQQVILTTHLPNLGSEADVVKVRAGYARNFLFPRGLAYEVTPASLRKLNTLKTKRAEREAKDLNDAQEQAGKINKIKLTMVLETGATGKAFGSISVRDIEERLAKDFQGLKIEKHMIQLDKPIKETGEHDIPVRLHPEVMASFKVIAQSSAVAGDEKASEAAADSTKKRPVKRKS